MPVASADTTAPPDSFARVWAAVNFIRERHATRPTLGIILGSGLGNFATQVDDATTIAYADIPGWPLSTVQGHAGKLVLGTITGVPIAVMAGRVHAYEGYSMAQVTFPTRVLGLLGCQSLVVTNAAGGVNTSYAEGGLVLLSDHINFTGLNAAAGPNEPRFAMRPETACASST